MLLYFYCLFEALNFRIVLLESIGQVIIIWMNNFKTIGCPPPLIWLEWLVTTAKKLNKHNYCSLT